MCRAGNSPSEVQLAPINIVSVTNDFKQYSFDIIYENYPSGANLTSVRPTASIPYSLHSVARFSQKEFRLVQYYIFLQTLQGSVNTI